MSIGSAFDAYIKSHIYSVLFGKEKIKGTPYELNTIFEKQVESQHRIWAREHGKVIFDRYVAAGALADLMLMLNKAIGTPRFEFDLQSEVRGKDRNLAGVMFLGKPDLYFTSSEGIGVSLDWKVNGYCGGHNTSPKPGYVRIMPGFQMHKDCVRHTHKGIVINKALTLDKVDRDWAEQLSIYSWLCGEPVGGDFIVAIDQIACKPTGSRYPELRFAQHRLTIDPEFQHEVYRIAEELWNCIQSGHYYSEMTREESDSRCAIMDAKAAEMWTEPATIEDAMFRDLTKVRAPGSWT